MPENADAMKHQQSGGVVRVSGAGLMRNDVNCKQNPEGTSGDGGAPNGSQKGSTAAATMVADISAETKQAGMSGPETNPEGTSGYGGASDGSPDRDPAAATEVADAS